MGVLSDRNILAEVPATAENLGKRKVREVLAMAQGRDAIAIQIASFTFMVPISAAKAAPERPAAMIAVISGPSSRVTERPTRLAT